MKDHLDVRKASLYTLVGLAVGYFILSSLHIFTTYILGSEITKPIRSELYANFAQNAYMMVRAKREQPGMLTEKLGQGCETISQLASVLVFVMTVIFIGVTCCYAIGFAFSWQIVLLGLGFLSFNILFVYFLTTCLNVKLHVEPEEVLQDV